jgi:hypothetical protein
MILDDADAGRKTYSSAPVDLEDVMKEGMFLQDTFSQGTLPSYEQMIKLFKGMSRREFAVGRRHPAIAESINAYWAAIWALLEALHRHYEHGEAFLAEAGYRYMTALNSRLRRGVST